MVLSAKTAKELWTKKSSPLYREYEKRIDKVIQENFDGEYVLIHSSTFPKYDAQIIDLILEAYRKAGWTISQEQYSYPDRASGWRFSIKEEE